MIETTDVDDGLFSLSYLYSILISLFWKHLEAHCFHYFLTVLWGVIQYTYDSQSENSEISELTDTSKTTV